MSLFRTINLVEGIWWIAVGAGFALSLIRRHRRGAKLIAACNFTAFGFSDFVEMGTGAWWRPWWLLVWKGACVIIMLVQCAAYARARRRMRGPGRGDPAE